MGTKQHYVLFENASGYSLFLVKEFDEIIKNFSAHVNSFLKPVAFVPFNSLSEALENVQAISEGRVSSLLSDFLHQNLPVRDAVLGVADRNLGEAVLQLDIGFECNWDSSVHEILRIIRTNSSRLLRSLIVQPGAPNAASKASTTAAQEAAPGRKLERRTQLIVALTRARLQLDIAHYLADTGIVRSLDLLDSMDKSLAKSLRHLRISYGLHFPELCRNGGLPGLDDFVFVSIVTNIPSRDQLVKSKDQLIEWLNGDARMAETIIELAKTSTGQDLSSDDLRTLQHYGQFLLNLLKSRTQCLEMLERRVQSLVPNLAALLGQTLPKIDVNGCLKRVRKVGDCVSPAIVAARLISHAVNLDRLAKMPSSRINSLGASKSLFRRSGAVAATAAGLLGRTVSRASQMVKKSKVWVSAKVKKVTDEAEMAALTQSIVEMSGGRLRAVVVRRRVARLLAAKSTLAARADCYRRMNPFVAGVSACKEAKDMTAAVKLDSGEYGVALGQETKRQLRVWAEANGVHLERSVQELEKQREHRKKYRKAKRKAWLKRKLTANSTSLPKATSKDKPLDIIDEEQPLNLMENNSECEINAAEQTLDVMPRKRCIGDVEISKEMHSKRSRMEVVTIKSEEASEAATTRVLQSSSRQTLSVQS